MSEITKSKKHRFRASVVCSACKKKKIKCDRKKPCSNCIKASSINSCNYHYQVKKIDGTLIQIIEDTDNDLNKNINQKKSGDNEIKDNENNQRNNLTENNTKFPFSSLVPGLPASPLPSATNSNNNYSFDRNANNKNECQKNSILDVDFDLNTSYLILRKPSRTVLCMDVFNNLYSHDNFFSFKFMLSFKKMFNKGRKIWKDKNFKKKLQLAELCYYNNNDPTFEDNGLNLLVEKLVCNNYYAILERLGYFQKDLNKILFNSYIPMGVVQLIFHNYFIMKREGIVFKRPNKNFEYCFIALITSLVELTNVFTKYDPSIFNFPLPDQNDEFNQLSVLLLNASNYRRKCSIFAVYTLLNLRLSLMVYGDAQSAGILLQNTYPLFQSAVNISVEMGLNVDQNKVTYLTHESFGNLNTELDFAKEIPIDLLKRLWNQLLILDASYYTAFSAIPYIDDRFSHGFYSIPGTSNEIYISYINVVKDVALTFSGKKTCTLRELFESTNKITRVLSRMESFANFQSVEKNEEKWELFLLKFKLLRLLSIQLFHIYSLLNKTSLIEKLSKEILDDTKNQEVLKLLINECSLKCRLIYFIILNTMLKISKSSLSYKFLHYNREIFSCWIGFQGGFFVDLIINKDIEDQKAKAGVYSNSNFTVDFEKATLPNAPIFDTKKLEETLYNFDVSKHAKTLQFIEAATTPGSIVSLMSLVYESILDIPILYSDYKFFTITKICVVTIYFLQCYIKVHCENFLANEHFLKLKDLTNKIVSKHFSTGKVTHLVPPEQILTEIDENITNNKNEKVSLLNSPQIAPLVTESSNPNSNASLWNFNIISQSKIENFTSSIFDDEAMISLFNDIDELFSKSLD